MDIYEATQALLTAAVPDANVSSFLLSYDEKKDEFVLPEFPAVTYNCSTLTPIVSHDGSGSLYRINLDVEVWGDLEQIDTNANAVIRALNAKRVQAENVELTLVMIESRDIAELELDFKRRFMRFTGLADIGEVTHG